MPVQFPAYRRHDEARIRVNDTLMAILASSRLAESLLESVADKNLLLPEAFPDRPDLTRMNRSIADSHLLIGRAERQLVYMAIPYLLSVHEAYVVDCIEMVTERSASDEQLRLEVVHSAFTESVGAELPADLLALFDLLRHLRNRIVHYAAVQGSHLREKWDALPSGAEGGWRNVAGRQLPIGRSDEELDLGVGELIASLMVVTRLGREVSNAMARALSRDRWADIVVADYREHHPAALAQRSTRLRRCLGYAGTHYGALRLESAEIDDALRRDEA